MPRPKLNRRLLRVRAVLAGAAGALGCGALAYPLRAESATDAAQATAAACFSPAARASSKLGIPKPGAKTGGPFRAISTSLPGVQIGELLPHTAKIMHRLTVVRSVNSNIPDHFQGHYAMQSGRIVPGYPVLGFGRGQTARTPGDVLPGYVSIRRDGPKAYTDVGDAGFLGAKYEGVRILNNLPPENLVRPAERQAVARRGASMRMRRASNERFRRGREPRRLMRTARPSSRPRR